MANVPAEYELIAGGRGTQSQIWGDDSEGTDEPFTVLAPAGHDASSPEAVVVSVTGFAGYEGGLDQAARGYSSEAAEHFRLEGKPAIFTPAGETFGRARPADLLVQHGEDLAVRVTTASGTREELIEVSRRVQPGARSDAPGVPNPPAGLQALGSVDAHLVVGLSPHLSKLDTTVPGTNVSHSAGWLRERSMLGVMTVPGASVDLPALSGITALRRFEQFEARSRSVGDRPGIVLDPIPGSDPPGFLRAVVTEAPWGDVVIVTAYGQELRSEDELVAIASSVNRADDASWQAFVTAVTTPSAVEPDAGAVELARGRAGDLDWLLQARPASDVLVPGPVPSGGAEVVADPCLKLSNRRLVCTDGASVSADGDAVHYATVDAIGERRGFAFPPFVVVTTRIPGATVHVETRAGTATGMLYELPGGGRWGGLVFVERLGLPGCLPLDDPRVPPGLDVMRVEVLDIAGQPAACLGFVPG